MIHLVEVAEVGQELAREVRGLGLDLAPVAHGAVGAGLEDLFHTPVLADAVVDAGQAILGAQVEEGSELVFNLRPGQLLDHAVVHDEELLLLAVGGAGRARDSGERLGDHGGVGGLLVVVVMVVMLGVLHLLSVVCLLSVGVRGERSVDAAERVGGVVRGG